MDAVADQVPTVSVGRHRRALADGRAVRCSPGDRGSTRRPAGATALAADLDRLRRYRPPGIARRQAKDAELLGMPGSLSWGRGWTSCATGSAVRLASCCRRLLATDIAAAVTG